MLESSSTMKMVISLFFILFPDGQFDDEGAPAAATGFAKNPAAVLLDQRAAKRQADSRSFDAGMDGIIDSIEFIENLFAKRSRNPGAPVENPHHNPFRKLFFQSDPNFPS